MNEAAVAPAEVPEAEVKAPKKKSKKVWPKDMPGKTDGKTGESEFSGRVTRVTVKARTAGGPTVTFELKGKKATKHDVTLDPADPFAASAMLGISCAALASGDKLHVRTSPAPAGGLFASELELRVKR